MKTYSPGGSGPYEAGEDSPGSGEGAPEETQVNEGKLDIDDMTAMRITIGKNPQGLWVIDASALGHGCTTIGIETDEIAGVISGAVAEYLAKAEALR